MKSNRFPKQKNLVRSEALFLQISLTSGLKGEKSWIFPFAFTVYCNVLFWLKYRKKIQSHTDVQLEKGEVF